MSCRVKPFFEEHAVLENERRKGPLEHSREMSATSLEVLEEWLSVSGQDLWLLSLRALSHRLPSQQDSAQEVLGTNSQRQCAASRIRLRWRHRTPEA